MSAPRCIREFLPDETDGLHCLDCTARAWPEQFRALVAGFVFGQDDEAEYTVLINDAEYSSACLIVNTTDDLDALESEHDDEEFPLTCHQCNQVLYTLNDAIRVHNRRKEVV